MPYSGAFAPKTPLSKRGRPQALFVLAPLGLVMLLSFGIMTVPLPLSFSLVGDGWVLIKNVCFITAASVRRIGSRWHAGK
jgi:hypothetical protein